MTKKSADFILLLDASKIVNKSVRTLKRYLDKVDKVDKIRMSTLSKGRILVSLEFVDLVKSGFFKNSIKKQIEEPFEEKKEIPNEKDKRIETLESKNKELFDIIKDKDKQLQGKDELIKENLQDFKLLTSKVLFLQERNVELQQPVEKNAQEENKNVAQGTLGSPNFSDSLLLFFAVGFIGLLVLVGYLVLN
jgi:hypothetical protein